MDSNKGKTPTDNSNAPGTFPTPAPITQPTNTSVNLPSAATYSGNDPKAPFSSDPLNSGSPMTSAAVIDGGNEPTSVIELELGGTGTIIVGGILSNNDYNPDFIGPKRIDIYDQMRLGDATVRLGLMAVKHPITSAKWFIKPGDNEDDQSPRVKFVEEELFQNPNFSFVQFMHQALLFCDYGNSFFEKVFRMRSDGMIGWKKFAQRLPKTIYKYGIGPNGNEPGITQYLPVGGIVEIPQWKLLMFVNDLEGANYEGISMLRAVYKHWYYKDTMYKIDAIASERQGMGVPIIHVPPQATPEDKAKARLIAKNMRVNEHAYVDLPTGFSIEYIDTHSKELKEVKEMVMHHDREILKGFLAHFLDMGATSAGSHNLSNDQSELFQYSLKYVAHIFQDQVNHAIREVVDLNYSGTKPSQYPTLQFGHIGSIDLMKLSTGLKNLTDAGILIPDDNLEQHVRGMADLPDAMNSSEDQNVDPEVRGVSTPQSQWLSQGYLPKGLVPIADGQMTPGRQTSGASGVQVTDPTGAPQKTLAAGSPQGKSVRTANSNAKQQYMEAMQFMEDVMALKTDLETAITAKENEQ